MPRYYSSPASQTARQWGSQLLGQAERSRELGEALRYQTAHGERENRLRPYRALLSFGARQKAAREERHAEPDAGGGAAGSMAGTAAGAGIGFAVGGPPGALIGAGIGAGAGQSVGNVVDPPTGGGNRGVQEGLDRTFDSWGRMYDDQDPLEQPLV